MTGLALWLALVAVLDVIRGGRDATRSRFVLVLTGVGAVLAVLTAAVLGPSAGGGLAWAVATLGLIGWMLGSAVAAARFRGAPVPALSTRVDAVLAAGIAFASLAGGVVALLLAGRAAGMASGVLGLLARSGLAHVPGDRVLLVAALVLLQVSTANVLVRMLLDLVGVPASDNEKKLRGGRVLGPMERLLILGMGIGGSLLGAAIVVAAKALLRFPELRVPRAGDPGYGGASDVTEYFLVGSFASWLVALVSVGLAALVAG